MTHRRAFTIIELLVVVGILALLVGILLPALAGAQKRSFKTSELNSLRTVGVAWNLYATANTDAVLPGFLEPDVQQRWRVTFEYPDRSQIPPAPTFSSGTANLAGPWPWRLAGLLDFNYETLRGYADAPEFDMVNIATTAEAEQIALNPAFGYNALYVGGWWEMTNGIARPRYFDAPKPVVSRSLGTIRRSSDLIIFASSSSLTPGIYRKFPNQQPGFHMVAPPWIGEEPQWRSLGAGSGGGGNSTTAQSSDPQLSSGGVDPATLQVLSTPAAFVAAPIGRYTRLVALLNADGHTDSAQPGALMDIRRWIDQADSPDFRH